MTCRSTLSAAAVAALASTLKSALAPSLCALPFALSLLVLLLAAPARSVAPVTSLPPPVPSLSTLGPDGTPADAADFDAGRVASRRGALLREVSAQVPNPPAQRLVSATAIDCTFTTLATGTWRDGAAEASTRGAKLSLAFTSIDTQDGTADAVGDNRKAHITVRVVGNYMTFIQLDPYGAIHVTTVFNTEPKPGRLLAVHSRHEYTPVQLPGLTSRPEQYYGDCGVK